MVLADRSIREAPPWEALSSNGAGYVVVTYRLRAYRVKHHGQLLPHSQ